MSVEQKAWSLQDAKARFSELVNCSLSKGPQLVTRHGRPAVVVVPFAEYERLQMPMQGLGDFFRAAPRVELFIERSKDTGREIDL